MNQSSIYIEYIIQSNKEYDFRQNKMTDRQKKNM